MLIVLFYFLLISLTCLWTGYISHFYFAKLLQKQPPALKPLPLYLLWGLIGLVMVSQILVLLMPVNQTTWMGWMMVLAAVTFWRRKELNIGPAAATLFALSGWQKAVPYLVIVLFISQLSAGPLQMDDTESYHVQMIKWIQEYGSVPGLANLHERYGFNSSWFSFVAFFTPARATGNYYSIPNGLLSVWFCCYLFYRTQPFTRRPTAVNHLRLGSLVVLMAALLCWPMIRGNATTANYDCITTTLLVVLLIELAAASRSEWQRYLPELILWPVFLFSVRILNFPLLLLSLWGIAVAIRKRKWGFFTGSLVASALLVVPFLIRNVILSGYLFYPACQIDLFPVDWKADPGRTQVLVDFIRYFNRVNTGFVPLAITEKLAFPDWIPVWFHYLFRYDKPVLIIGLGGYLLCLICWKLFMKLTIPVRGMAAVMVLQLVCWFFIAPDPRFVYGPLLCGIFLLCLMLPVPRLSVSSRVRFVLPVVLLGWMGVYTVWRNIRYPESHAWVYPVQLPQPVTRTVLIDGIELRIPEKMPGNWNPRCYGTALPCLYEIVPGLHARGRTVADGFKLAP